MKSLTIASIVSMILFFNSAAGAAEIKTEAAITSVVVYPDRALVTRTAEIDLPKGEHTIVFANLPANIDTESLRTSGEGTANVRIYSVESRKVVLERPREEQIAQLEVEIESVRDQTAAAEARIGNLEAERKLVDSIGVYSGQQLSKEFVTRQPTPNEWKAMVDFHRVNLARLGEEMQETEILKRTLTRRLDALLRELAEIQGQSQRAGQEVKVDLAALNAGKFNLYLSCVVYGASWYPSYDARADLKREIVEIVYIGNIRQNTGEEWPDVDISLSTARPAVGAKMPDLTPWYLRPQPPIQYEREALDERAAIRQKLEAFGPPAPAETAVAQVVQRGTSVQFKIPRKMEIPSDNAYHRATVLMDSLPTKLSYATTPRLSPFAYLTARIKNSTGVQWLTGKVSVFVDGDFVGTSGFIPVAPNEEIDLHLGVDEGIKVEREELVRKEDETRIFGKKRERGFKDRITIENLKSGPISITLIDHVPVSQHDDIKVTDLQFSKKPTEHDTDKGLVKWNLGLAPGKKEQVVIEFAVTHPLEMSIPGL